MSKFLLTATSVVLGCSLISYAANADTSSTSTTNSTSNTSSSSSSSNLSKDEWLKSVTPLLPELICKGFENDVQLKQRLDDIKMTHDQCMSVIPESVSKCQQQIYANIPDQLSNESASVWGKKLGECIGQDFSVKYLIPKTTPQPQQK
ncbi:MAG: hypothetical protein ACRCXC_02080 [Legionella sp.]